MMAACGIVNVACMAPATTTYVVRQPSRTYVVAQPYVYNVAPSLQYDSRRVCPQPMGYAAPSYVYPSYGVTSVGVHGRNWGVRATTIY